MLHMLQWLYTYVASVCSKCFICFQTYAANVLSGCCICFTQMLQVFYLDVACLTMTFKCFQVFCKCYVCCKCFSCFERMLQVFHLDVTKIDLVLHMLQWAHLPQQPAAAAGAPPSGRRRSHVHACGKRRGAQTVPACGLVAGAV
jgi:hypothetical protein